MTQTRVMLLIDADNVSVDVIEQAVQQLLAEYGALHVRRAYCTAESALKHQQLFKRLAIRPMVNLAAGKNSTDIALAVDALDLAVSERPDVMVIASSDSDFAPLVARLREKGCRVCGFGQKGKTGDETLQVYDAYTVLEHRPSQRAHRATAKRPAAAPPVVAAAQSAATAAAERVEPVKPAEPAKPGKPAKPGNAAKSAARRGSRRKTEPAGPDAAAPTPTPAPPPRPEAVASLLRALPELARGDTIALQDAAKRLRDAGLLSNRASSTRLFRSHADHFELQPEHSPTRLRLRT